MFFKTLLALGLMMVAGWSGSAQADEDDIQITAETVTLTDAPVCHFKNIHWDYLNLSNPFILTKNHLDHSMIDIQRLPKGKTLPHGKTPLRDNMDLDAVRQLMLEDLHGRGIDQIDAGSQISIAGTDAVKLEYHSTFQGRAQRAVVYGFMEHGVLFQLRLLGDADAFDVLDKDFETLVGSFALQ